MTEKQIRKLLAFWQKRLSLQDWTIDFSLVPKMTIAGFGECSCDEQAKIATVRLTKPDEIYTRDASSEAIKDDIEDTIVHELLHIWFHQARSGDNKHAVEHGVRAITKALL